MAGVEQVNHVLKRLDGALRSKRIDLADYRRRRRQLLKDFEDGSSATTPDAVIRDLNEDDTVERPRAGGETVTPASEPGRGAGLAIAATIVGLVLLLAGWWLMFGRTEQPAPSPIATVGTSSLPVDAANQLLASNWTAEDMTAFLDEWARFSPESITAASDDPRIWLLRGEVERRLRSARDTQSLGDSAELAARIQSFEQIQATIRVQ